MPKIGLALGSGSARGWSHVGVLLALREEGIEPDLVCGASIGAFVGAAYANGDLNQLESWVATLTWQDVLGLLDFRLKGGIIHGGKLMGFFERNFVDRRIEDLARPFIAVATDLISGHEVWLREGKVARAVHASLAMPGLFAPVAWNGSFLVDGGLVNPVPVSVCRAMGAEVVIAVDLASDLVGRSAWREGKHPPPASQREEGWARRVLALLSGSSGANGANGGTGNGANGHEVDLQPSLVAVVSGGINIMQVRIARSRLAGEPADVLLSPRLGHLGLMDYHRGAEAIAEGRAAVRRMLPAIEHALRG